MVSSASSGIIKRTMSVRTSVRIEALLFKIKEGAVYFLNTLTVSPSVEAVISYPEEKIKSIRSRIEEVPLRERNKKSKEICKMWRRILISFNETRIYNSKFQYDINWILI